MVKEMNFVLSEIRKVRGGVNRLLMGCCFLSLCNSLAAVIQGFNGVTDAHAIFGILVFTGFAVLLNNLFNRLQSVELVAQINGKGKSNKHERINDNGNVSQRSNRKQREAALEV